MSQKSEMSCGKKRRLSATGGFKTGETSNCSGITSPATSWEDLPPELLQKVMADLPMHAVCRARTVCKTWNHVITQPESAATRALTPRQGSDSVLIAPKWTEFSYPAYNPRTEWEVLDVAENHSSENHSGRCYTLRDAIGFYGPNANANNSESSFRRFFIDINPLLTRLTLAADRELVYTMLAIPLRRARVHIVCNPVRKSLHEIPELELIKKNHSFEHDIVVMSVQSATSAYKIIVMDSYARVHPRSEQVHLYDSTTSVWRTLCELPSRDYYAYSSIFVNGVLYTLFVDITTVPWRRMLFTCDLASGAWTYIDVELPPPSHLQDKAQLVASSGRLFMVEYTGLPLQPSLALSSWEALLAARRTNRKQLVNVGIWEILLAKQKVVKVAGMRNFAKYSRKMLNFLEEMVVAVGCTDSIVIISCLMGRRVAFDLSKKCWLELCLPHPLPHRDRNRGVFAGVVDF